MALLETFYISRYIFIYLDVTPCFILLLKYRFHVRLRIFTYFNQKWCKLWCKQNTYCHAKVLFYV